MERRSLSFALVRGRSQDTIRKIFAADSSPMVKERKRLMKLMEVIRGKSPEKIKEKENNE